MTNIEHGKTYVKRSQVSGKARSFRAIETRGTKIVCIADDNGKTVIVSRFRLHADSRVLVDNETMAVSPELSAALDRFLSNRKG
jgi:hypothetical protein